MPQPITLMLYHGNKTGFWEYWFHYKAKQEVWTTETKLIVKTKCIVTRGREKVAHIGRVCRDEVGLSMCVISHVRCGQPPGTHSLILSLSLIQQTPTNSLKIFSSVTVILAIL